MSVLQLEIPARSRKCCVEQEDFSSGSEYYSLLELDDECYKRKDFCPDCWKKHNTHPVADKSKKIFWKSRVPLKTDASPQTIQRDQYALQLLREFLQSGRKEEEPQAFVLALFLARSKLLRCINEVKENGKHVFLYEVAATEEILPVKKVDLSTDQAEEVRKVLAAKCKHI